MENFLKIILQTTTGETIDLDFTGPVLSGFWWLLTEFWWLWSICVVLVILSQIANSKPRKKSPAKTKTHKQKPNKNKNTELRKNSKQI